MCFLKRYQPRENQANQQKLKIFFGVVQHYHYIQHQQVWQCYQDFFYSSFFLPLLICPLPNYQEIFLTDNYTFYAHIFILFLHVFQEKGFNFFQFWEKASFTLIYIYNGNKSIRW